MVSPSRATVEALLSFSLGGRRECDGEGGGEEGENKGESEEEEEEEDAAAASSFITLRRSKRKFSNTSNQSSAEKMATRGNSSPAALKISKPAIVTPSKGEGATTKVGTSKRVKYADHFKFSPTQIKEAIEYFNMFGFVKLHPCQAFKDRTKDLIKCLDHQAISDGKSLDKVLRSHVDEPMSTALGDKKRKMYHEKNYPTKGKHKQFFKIMRELNKHFVAGNQSALRMLTSNLQKKDKPLEIFHDSTEVLDIISLPGAKNQNEHMDAFFKQVKWLLYLLSTVFLLVIEGSHHTGWTCQHNIFFTSRRTDRRPRYSNACAKLAPKRRNPSRVDS